MKASARSAHRLVGLLVFALVSFAAISASRAERPDFEMSVSPKEVSFGEPVTLTVEIDLPGLSGPDRYWHPDTSLFKIVDSQIKRGTQTTMDPDKGQQLRTREVYRYVLQPQDTGRLLIGPAKIRIGGDEWETRQVSVKVRAVGGIGASAVGIGHTDANALDAPGYRAPEGPQPDVFLYAVSDVESAWVGQQITVSWLLFTRAEVLKYEPTPPELAGLWSETLFEPSAFFKYSDARIGEKDYVVAMVSKRALFASSPGKLTIAPLEAKIATVSTALGRVEPIRSNPLKVQIKALPEPAPQGFDPSYVGKYSIAAAVDRDLLKAGQPLTLSLKIAGTGAIARTTPPRLSFPGFVFEEPRDHAEKKETSGDLVGGERLYRYWTTPSQGGEQSIPAIELPFFDVETGRYEVARTTAIGITVEGNPEDLAEEERQSAAARSLDRDIRLLRSTNNLSSRVLVDLYRESWFWWLLGLPPGLYVVVVATDRFRRRLKRETPRARLRRARGKARSHYKVAEIHLRGLRPAKFFAELSHAIYGHMEEWLEQSMQSMTRSEMQVFLKERGVDSTTIKRIVDDLESFDRARFAPSKSGADEMRAALRRTKELLARVESTKLRVVEEDKP